MHTYIGTIKMPIGKNNWDIETYTIKLENIILNRTNHWLVGPLISK